MIFLLGLAFVLSAAEVALYTITSSGEQPGGKITARLLKSPQLLLSTILVSNAVTVFMFTLIGAAVAIDVASVISIDKFVAVGIEIVTVSGLLIFFADAVPKIVAFRNAKLVLCLSFPILLILLVV